MWKYFLLNGIWFLMLVLVQFFGSSVDQLVIFGAIVVLGAVLAVKGAMDPIAWTYYFAFSLLVFYGTRHSRNWAFLRLDHSREEYTAASEKFISVRSKLDEQKSHTAFLERKSDEIVEFYDQIKELSKSLDPLETFVVFAEALAEYFDFKVAKLALFGDKRAESLHPQEVYELRGADLKVAFDRSLYLKDRKRCRGEVFPFDQKIFQTVFGDPRATSVEKENEYVAFPIRIHDRVFAVLTIVGTDAARDALFSILIERFISELQRVKLYESVQKLAITDGLTGIFVRQHLLERLEGEVDRSKRFNLKLSFLMIDIDFFKNFNDEYGHLVGDVVLRQVAQAIQKNVREVDFVGRYGGEEFGVGLIETDEGTAFLVAERIRRSIQERAFKAYDETLKVNVSIGSATLSNGVSTVSALVEAADSALYQAKRLGRNRVCMAGGMLE